MAKIPFNNTADFTGVLGIDSPIEFSSTIATTTIVNGLTAEKTADKDFWVNGPLEYTIVVTNNTGEDFSEGVLTDSFNTAIVTVDEARGVTIDGVVTPHTYSAGLLTVPLPTIADTKSITIKFQILLV